MKQRDAQFGVRKNLDSERVYGLRLTVNSVPTQPQEQAEIEEQHAPTGIERPITCKEASQVLGVHPRTIKRMAREGKVPGHFRFGRWFFYASELDCWMRTELNSLRHP
jgi:excisionase family DNA binding protein